jgi:two-component system nitrate/nitrite sensor histidine kinase NarX
MKDIRDNLPKRDSATLAALINNLPGMAYRCQNDRDRTMEIVTEGSLGLTGYCPGDLIDSQKVSYRALIHPDDQDENEIQAALNEGRPFQFAYRIKTPIVEKWVWEQGRGVSNSNEEIIALEGYVTDVTELLIAQRNLEQRVEERTRELSTLLDISHNLASTLDLEPLLDLILDQLGSVVGYDAASIMILDYEVLKILAYRGPIPRDEALQIKFSIQTAIANQEVIQQREPVIIADIRGEGALAHAIRETAGDELETTYSYLRCWMGVPLIVKDRVVGMLTLDHQQPGYYASSQAELAMAFASQAAVAIENARLYQQAEQVAITHERHRLARDLHDAVTQTLFSASLIADVLPKLWERNPDVGRERLEELRLLTRGALSEMRTLLFELRPDSLIEVDLADLFKHITNAFAARTRIPMVFTQEGQSVLPPNVKEAFYRIAQEALNNITKHAGASQVQLQLVQNEECVEVNIQDDGCGFDPAALSAENLGLKIMRERAESVRAEIVIQSEPGVGTCIHVHWPASIEQQEKGLES